MKGEALDDVLADTSFIPDTTAPSAPTNLNATALSSTRVDLAWTAATDNQAVTGYQVNRNGSLIATIGVQTTYTDLTATAGTSYSYAVVAFDAAGNLSAPSNTATVTTPSPDTTAPTVPTGLSATAASATEVDLGWTASSDDTGVAGYGVYRDGVHLADVGGTLTSFSDFTVARRSE